MKFLVEYFKRYQIIKKRMDRYTTIKTVIYATLLSVLTAGLMALPFILMTISLFMFVHLQVVSAILLIIIAIASVILYQFMYFKYIKWFHPELVSLNTWVIIGVESTIISIVLLIIGTIVAIQIFGRI